MNAKSQRATALSLAETDAKVAASFSSRIQDVLPRTKDSYYKLVLAVGAAGTAKTAALNELGAKNSWPRVNINLRLSEKLIELTHRQRATRVAGIVDEILRDQKSDIVLLDNIELLFADELALDPLRLFQSASRNRTLIVAWPGSFDGASLTYAEPGHPEAKKYTSPQATIVQADEKLLGQEAK
jgi:hypothetical protein